MNADKQKDPSQNDIKFILNLLNSNKLNDAKKEIDKHLIQHPNSSILFNILGAVYAGKNNFDEAINYYKKATTCNPNYAQAYNNLGVALHKLEKISEAIENYQKAINLNNNFAEALNNLGNALIENNKSNEAITFFERALKIKPNYPEALNSIGGAYANLGNRKKAIGFIEKAIKIKPEYAEAHNSLALIYSDLARFEEALLHFTKSIELKPYNEKFYNNFGNLLNNLGKYEEANKMYEKAINIKPNYEKAYSNLIFNLNYFYKLDQNLYLEKAKKFGLKCKPIKKNLTFKYKFEKKPKKLRIGLVSSDFGNHPGGFFTLSTLKELRKKDFELIAYSNSNRQDEFSYHFKPLFFKWHSIEKIKDLEVVKKIFDDGIHILMELQGHSAKNRIPLFFYKAAPVQVSWLSTGTLGVSEINYLIGSSHMTPKNEEKNYVEKIWKLPNITQCFTPPDFQVKINKLPAIDNNFITFGCVNKLTKINDHVIKLWSKILLSVDKSKLLLKNKDFDNQGIIENTFKRFEKYKVDRGRLILRGESITRKELLQTYNEIDIALDPFPFQGNTSTCEAVWMGVPVVTLLGDRMVFHTGESINSNLKMKNWIAKKEEDYVSIAVKFASDIDYLSKIRMNLREHALQSPVFNSPPFAENFGKMLWEMWSIYTKG